MKPGIGLIGRKLGMTNVFHPDGRVVPVSVLEAGPCTVVQAKSPEKDGYKAVQLGFSDAKEARMTKAVIGHFKKAGVTVKQVLGEFRLPEDQKYEVGAVVSVDIFKPGDRVDITGTSIGKGFQGGVKRWHWKGGPQTHGSMSHRAPGSIGSTTTPGRVYKGHHLPGRMAARRVTTQAVEVIRVDAANHLLLVKGSVPGHNKGILFIRKSRKKPRSSAVIVQPAKKKTAAPAAAKAAAAAKGAAAPKGGAKK